MNGVGRAAAVGGFTLVGAALMTRALYAWPDLLPHPLRRLGNAIVEASGSNSIETSSDVELVYLFVLCSSVMLLFATIVSWIAARWSKLP